MIPIQTDTVTCRECGQMDAANYLEPTRSRMIAQQLCFICLFWTDMVPLRADPANARIGGIHYHIGPENDTHRELRGFGGNLSIIHFADGREVATTNLWHQGKIPDHFRDRLPDNAAFAKGP